MPPRPDDALPEPILIDPLSPSLEVPVLNTIKPLTPVTPAFDVCKRRSPLDVRGLYPVIREMMPPLAKLEVPADKRTSPPVPLFPRPTVSKIDPLRPPAAVPVAMLILPLAPELDVPVRIATTPLDPEVPALAV